MILSDNQIYRLANAGMIAPFESKLLGKAEKVLSWGPSSYGYDIRLGTEFKEIADPDDVIDPKTITEQQYRTFTQTKPFILEGHSFILGRSVEKFKIPRNVVGIVTNKSTYARCGADFSRTTVLEPGWEGVLTIEIANSGRNPIKIYPNEGACQILFFRANDDCDLSYADRVGKYLAQEGVTIPKV